MDYFYRLNPNLNVTYTGTVTFIDNRPVLWSSAVDQTVQTNTSQFLFSKIYILDTEKKGFFFSLILLLLPHTIKNLIMHFSIGLEHLYILNVSFVWFFKFRQRNRITVIVLLTLSYALVAWTSVIGQWFWEKYKNSILTFFNLIK